MPKEQGHFGERADCSASKNAKDKSNSATLRASQGGTHKEQSGLGDMSNRIFCCDSERYSEKDSGYSEAGSDSVHTDVDDQRSSVSKPHRKNSKSLNKSNGVIATGCNMPPYEELAPIYVIKNLIVKPSRTDQLLHGPLAWGGGWHNLTSAKAPTQLLLIQQPGMPAPSTTPPTPSSSHSVLQCQVLTAGNHSNQNHSSKNSYLPILNSYPRIAPHPRKESHESKGSTCVEGIKESGSEGQSQSKRVCIDEKKREAVTTTTHLPKPQQNQKEGRVHTSMQYKGRGGRSLTSDNVNSPSVSSSQIPSPPASADSSSTSPPSSSPSSSTAHSSPTRQRRFLNTAEILNQSGLLAITLRTKELLKQNACTEREIAQLRQHTHLLCQVAQASQSRCSDGSESLDKLVQIMTKTASYPNLDLNQLKALSTSHQQSKTRNEEDKEKDNKIRTTKINNSPPLGVTLHKIDDATAPPSPLFAPSPDTEIQYADDPLDLMSTSLNISFPGSVPEEKCERVVLDKDLNHLTLLPGSSRHNNFLLSLPGTQNTDL